MTTNPNAAGPMGNWPRNREELNRYSWAQHAPEILAAMNVTGDPGPVPDELKDTAPIEWPEDEDDDEILDEPLEDDTFPDELTALRVELTIMAMEREERARPARHYHQLGSSRYTEPSAARSVRSAL